MMKSKGSEQRIACLDDQTAVVLLAEGNRLRVTAWGDCENWFEFGEGKRAKVGIGLRRGIDDFDY